MRLTLLTVAAFVSGIFVLAACNSRESANPQAAAGPTPSIKVSTQEAPVPSDNARRINVTEMYDLWQKGKILVVDTRTDPAYKESHIKGAILIPAGDVASKIGELPKDKMIVTYCT
jgi:3-mercaptopyruvate sulfurtransferase SseA